MAVGRQVTQPISGGVTRKKASNSDEQIPRWFRDIHTDSGGSIRAAVW
jgi:hypothetical protein